MNQYLLLLTIFLLQTGTFDYLMRELDDDRSGGRGGGRGISDLSPDLTTEEQRVLAAMMSLVTDSLEEVNGLWRINEPSEVGTCGIGTWGI